jgi:hypothetical protein
MLYALYVRTRGRRFIIYKDITHKLNLCSFEQALKKRYSAIIYLSIQFRKPWFFIFFNIYELSNIRSRDCRNLVYSTSSKLRFHQRWARMRIEGCVVKTNRLSSYVLLIISAYLLNQRSCDILRAPQKHKAETGIIWAALSVYRISIVKFSTKILSFLLFI